jgi:hypothetical protein
MSTRRTPRVFCNSACREAWKADRAAGLIYHAVWSDLIPGFAGRAYKNHYEFHRDNGDCPYCLGQVVKYRRRTSPWRASDGKPIDSAIVAWENA